MIPISEARVGNIVDLYGSTATIQRDDFNGFGIAIDKGEPIELTEEWLIKFQLPKRKVLIIGDSYYMEFSIRNDFEICCYMDKHGNCIFYGECGSEDFFIIKCNTVHAFQNIYATLNPHEKLIIK